MILVIASRNAAKLAEMKGLLRDFPVQLRGLDEFGPTPAAEETGATFEENAYLKASLTARILGLPALADDSGLAVAALGGRPGVYSARYAGPEATDAERCAKLLAEMAGRKDREATFHCVISIAVPTGQALTYEADCRGLIAETPAGAGGFGYDPIFFFPPMGKTFSEMTPEEKGRVSHRGKALMELVEEFPKVMTWLRIHLG